MEGIAKYSVKIKVIDELLASAPANQDVYKKYIESRAKEEKPDEVATLPAEEQEKVGWSVFHQDYSGLFIFDYMIRGFLKEAASSVSGKAITAYKSKIDRFCFVMPRRIYMLRIGGEILKPYSRTQQTEEYCERPIRAMTAQGPRVSLKRSNLVRNVEFVFEVWVLPLGQREITEKVLRSWLEYGQYQGLGEWRSGSYGRFTYELAVIEKGTPLVEDPKKDKAKA
jgi:hypothetical protein